MGHGRPPDSTIQHVVPTMQQLMPSMSLTARSCPLQNGALRRITFEPPCVTTIFPTLPPSAPPMPYLVRLWHRLKYLLFLTEPPEGADIIPQTKYYKSPRLARDWGYGIDMPPAAPPAAGRRLKATKNHGPSSSARMSQSVAFPGPNPGAAQEEGAGPTAVSAALHHSATATQERDTGLPFWHLTLEGPGILLVADQRYARAWRVDTHRAAAEELPTVDQATRAVMEASEAESSQTKAECFAVEGGGVVKTPRGPEGQRRAQVVPLRGLAKLGLPASWPVPAEPMSLTRFVEAQEVWSRQTGEPLVSAAATGEGRWPPVEDMDVGSPPSAPSLPQVTVFQCSRSIGPGRHSACLRIGIPPGYRLVEAPVVAGSAWVQCRGSVVDLSVLGGQLRGERVSWGQEWKEQLDADKWMEGAGQHLNASAETAGEGEGVVSCPGGDVLGETGGSLPVPVEVDSHGSDDGAADPSCAVIELNFDSSLGTAEVLVDAALYLQKEDVFPSNLDTRRLSLPKIHKLHARILLDVAEDGARFSNVTLELGSSQPNDCQKRTRQ